MAPSSNARRGGGGLRSVVVQAPHSTSRSFDGGFNCLCCTLCPCIHLSFLKTFPGTLKILEFVLSALCQTLLFRYGIPVSASLGSSFDVFLSTVSSCLLLVALLLFCYVVSANSFNLIRSSVLELVFNCVACFMYLSSSSHLSWTVQIYIWPNYLLLPGYAAYPALTSCYIMGMILGVLHGIDAYYAFKHLRGQ